MPATSYKGDPLDNLTHALVGASIGRSGARRTTPLATATLILAANIPDVDMASYLGGPYFALATRRGITHGVPALVLLAFTVTGIVLGWDRWVRRRRSPSADPARPGMLLLWAAVGVATHPLLDWMNTYGIRFGLPFDGTWRYGDALFIIDPWLWLILGGAVFLAPGADAGPAGRRGGLAWGALATLTSALILVAPVHWGVKLGWMAGLGTLAAARHRGIPRSPAAGERTARMLVATAATYVFLMVAARDLARAHVHQAARADDVFAMDILVSPSPGNPLISDVEVFTGESYVPGVHDWMADDRVEFFPDRSVPLLSGPPEMGQHDLRRIEQAAYGNPDVQYYLVWARYPYTVVERESQRWKVTVRDARYDDRAEAGSLGGVVTYLDEELRLTQVGPGRS
ncbi:MAG: metal-dependent hydrolase [Gemmatimonadota bacterium]|nr:metal-dependent hydrolase [Gemmatimonadota bacterium]MDH5760743.1 metal-dependent hydrolase [Gemmatimonadota bacterium]